MARLWWSATLRPRPFGSPVLQHPPILPRCHQTGGAIRQRDNDSPGRTIRCGQDLDQAAPISQAQGHRGLAIPLGQLPKYEVTRRTERHGPNGGSRHHGCRNGLGQRVGCGAGGQEKGSREGRQGKGVFIRYPFLLRRGMKICPKCKMEKSVSEFYDDPVKKTGKFARCKSCILKQRKIYRQCNPETLRKYERMRAKLPHRRQKSHERGRAWRHGNKEKTSAQNKCQYAIRVGKMVRLPCEVCGDKNSQGHHEDYSKSLEVIWLCPLHHYHAHFMSLRS